MALTSTEIREAARNLTKRLFTPDITANLDLDDLDAAVASIDASMETVINTIPAGMATKTVKRAIIDALPEPFQSTSTADQKAVALVVWALKEAGLI